jgi:hypothetical protein
LDATPFIIVGAIVFVALIALAFYLLDQKARGTAAAVPRLRACPVCGKELALGENILAERTGVVKEGREKILIKGCPHCLKRIT